MKRLIVAVVAAGVFAVSGCAGGAPSTAAVIENETITIAQAEQWAQEFNGVDEVLAGQSGRQHEPVTTAQYVQVLVQGALAKKALDDAGVPADEQQVEGMIADQSPADAMTQEGYVRFMKAFVYVNATQSLPADARMEAIKSADVTLNPLFGRITASGTMDVNGSVSIDPMRYGQNPS